MIRKSLRSKRRQNMKGLKIQEWEYIDEIDIDISNLVNFFSNGMGSYIVLDIKKDITNGAYLWSKSDLPKGQLDFWSVIDEWIVIGLDF